MLNACQSWLRRSLAAALRVAFASARAALFALASRGLAIIAKNTEAGLSPAARWASRAAAGWPAGRAVRPDTTSAPADPPALRRIPAARRTPRTLRIRRGGPSARPDGVARTGAGIG